MYCCVTLGNKFDIAALSMDSPLTATLHPSAALLHHVYICFKKIANNQIKLLIYIFTEFCQIYYIVELVTTIMRN